MYIKLSFLNIFLFSTILFSCQSNNNIVSHDGLPKGSVNNYAVDRTDDVSSTVQSGIRFFERRDYTTAIKYFSQALRENENDCDAYYHRGNLYFELGEYEKAISDYSKLLRLNSIRGYQITPTWLNRGNAYRNIGNYDEAINNFTSVIMTSTHNSDLSNIYELEESKKMFDKFIESAYFERALTYTAINDYNNALLDYSNAIRINSNNANYYNNRGNIYKLLKNNQKAIEDYLKALSINSNNFAYNYNLGQSYFSNEEFVKAISYFNKALDIGEDEPSRIYMYRGLSYYSIGEIDNAILDFEIEVKRNPNNNDLKEMLAELYVDRGVNYAQNLDFNNAVNDFRNAVKYDPRNERYKEMLRTAEFGKRIME